jgi:hypothetical protein
VPRNDWPEEGEKTGERKARSSGDLLPPTPPAEKASAR